MVRSLFGSPLRGEILIPKESLSTTSITTENTDRLVNKVNKNDVSSLNSFKPLSDIVRNCNCYYYEEWTNIFGKLIVNRTEKWLPNCKSPVMNQSGMLYRFVSETLGQKAKCCAIFFLKNRKKALRYANIFLI